MSIQASFVATNMEGSRIQSTSLIVPVAVTAAVVAVTIVKPSILIRPLQTWSSRIYVPFYLLLKSIQTKSASDKYNEDNTTVVTGLYKYPVKSLRAVPCEELTIDTKGFVDDRRYMLVTPAPKPLYGEFLPNDPTHRFMTQRQCPILARLIVTTDYEENSLTFTYDISSDELPNCSGSCIIPMQPLEMTPTLYKSTLWGDVVTVYDMGDMIAGFLQRFISYDTTLTEEMKQMPIRLVRQHTTDTRTANDKYVPSATRSLFFNTNPSVHLGDGFPILIASEASLEELNKRLKEKGKEELPMARFRPNIVIKGTTPFIEDRMKMIQIGNVLLYVVSCCPRCKESCTDQKTGVVTPEPVETMKEFRAVATTYPENVYFAVNAIPAPNSIGKSIHVGDTVKVLQWGDAVYSEG